jgi:hypothetical protein
MVTAPAKVPISAKLDGSRTAHLQLLIDFLKAQGNEPASADDFTFDRDGYGSYYFAQELDMEALRAQFDLPASIVAGQSAVYDSRNFVCITQAFGPQPVLSFEG